MPSISLDFRTRDYVTDFGVRLRSVRPFVGAQLGSVRPLCFVDTGAPLSIVSFSVAQQIRWKLQGRQLTFQGSAVSLDWQGIPCELGEAMLVLQDRPHNLQTGPCKLIGKFAKSVHPSLEGYVILGMNFLKDNGIDLEIHARAAFFVGALLVP